MDDTAAVVDAVQGIYANPMTEELSSALLRLVECLGSKALVADEMHRLTGRTYYDSIAQDTIAMAINDLITVGAVLVGLVVIGILAFFLPLRRLHRRMMLEKGLAREKLAKRFVPIMDDSATLTGVDKGVEHEALEVLKVDLMDRKVSSIATWPFDLPILGKLTIIVLSVTAGCLTRFVILFLHI